MVGGERGLGVREGAPGCAGRQKEEEEEGRVDDDGDDFEQGNTAGSGYKSRLTELS